MERKHLKLRIKVHLEQSMASTQQPQMMAQQPGTFQSNIPNKKGFKQSCNGCMELVRGFTTVLFCVNNCFWCVRNCSSFCQLCN